MDLYKNIRLIEQNLFAVDCDINNQSLFYQFDDKAWFMGLFYGLVKNDELICAITVYREESADITRYLNDVRSTFGQYGDVHRFALYRLSNGKVVAVQHNKRLTMRRSTLAKHNAPNFDAFSSSKKGTLTLKIYEEAFNIFDEESESINLGALTMIRNNSVIKPLYVFDRTKLSNKMLLEFINLITSHGDLVSGQIRMSYLRWQRYMMVQKSSKKLEENFPVYRQKFTLYEDYMHKVFVAEHSRMIRPQVLVSKNKLIQKHYEVGEFLNPDWFGQEFGFFINSSEDNRVYEFEPFPNRKASDL